MICVNACSSSICVFVCVCVCMCVYVQAKGNSCLNPEEMGMLVVLRMNRAFMKYMRAKHGTVTKFKGFPVVDELEQYIGVDPSTITEEEFKSAFVVPVGSS